MLSRTIIAAALLLLASCSADYDDKLDDLTEHVKNQRLGDGADVWLEKASMFGGWDRVALIFGYGDDYDACVDIAGLLSAKYTQAQYRCVPAN